MCVLIYEELNHSAVHLKLTQHCKWTLCVCIFVLSPVWHLAIPLCKPAAHQSPLSSSIPQNLLKCMSTEPVMLLNNIILCFPFLLLPSVFPNIRSFPMSRFFLIRWPNYLSFSFSISSSNEYSGLISSRIDWSPCSSRDAQQSSPASQFKKNHFFGAQPSLWIWI